MSTSATPVDTPSEIDQSQMSGAVEVLKQSVSALRETPVVIGLLLLVAFIEVVFPVGGNIVVLFAQCLAVFLVANTFGMADRNTTNSAGVRLLLAVIAAFIIGIAIVIGLFLLVLPGLYLIVRLYLVIPAVMIDDYGPVEALGESWTRTKGNMLTIGGVIVISLLIMYITGAIALIGSAGGIDAVRESIVTGDTALASAVMTVIGGSLVAATSVVIYHQTDG